MTGAGGGQGVGRQGIRDPQADGGWYPQQMADTDGVRRNCWEPHRLEQRAGPDHQNQVGWQGLLLERSQKNGPRV